MADGTIQILGQGTSAVPLTYTVSNADPVQLIAVKATFDGTAAGVDFVPMVEILSAAGQVMAFGKGASITAGDSATVTFAPFLGDDDSGVTPVVTLDTIITSLAPQAWWKLDEAAGTVAHDSSGNGFNMSVQAGGFGAPTWAQPAGPPGTQTANFTAGVPGAQVALPTFPILSGDFSAAVFANRSATLVGGNLPFKQFLGQGDPVQANQPGWELAHEAGNQGSSNHGLYYVGHNPGGPSAFESDAAISSGAWHFYVLTRTAGTFRYYVDGVLQAHTYAGAYGTFSGIWLGQDTFPQTNNTDALLSYAMVWMFRAISATDVAAMATAAGF